MQSALDVQVALATVPWALEPGAVAGLRLAISTPTALVGPPRAAAPKGQRYRGSTAVVQVHGTLVQHPGWISLFEMGTATRDIAQQLRVALADPAVDRIIMDFSTPGGEVFGTAELADEIRSARAQKPIIGIANSMAASAGYWLLSQCSEAYAAPGAQVGSIGVLLAHADESRAMDKRGVKVTLVSSGKYKTEGNSLGPLGTEAKAHLQQQVDTYFSMFTQAVARGRGVSVDVVRSKFGQGRTLIAEDAARAGMVDGVCTLADLLARRTPAPAPAARATAMRTRLPAALRAIWESQ